MDDIHTPTVASGPVSQNTADGPEKQMSLQELMAKKDDLEAEVSALSSVLDSHNADMSTSLTTPDGFPRSDIDVAQIRTTRARIIRLKTDHKGVMAKLEVAVNEHFAADKSANGSVSGPAAASAGAQAPSVGHAIEPPFARVNAVAASSPAASAGLQAGDKVTKFGSVNFSNHERLSKVAEVVQSNENRPVIVKVLRASQTFELQLTPRRNWGGRGLLGCHLVPL